MPSKQPWKVGYEYCNAVKTDGYNGSAFYMGEGISPKVGRNFVVPRVNFCCAKGLNFPIFAR